MPIYEYRCEKCGHRFERWQKMTDPDPRRCPECRAMKVERLISPVGFRLKGGGWYETDFKKDHRHNIAGDNESAGKKEKPVGGKSDGKKGETGGEKKTTGSGESKKTTGKTGEAA